MHPRHDPCTLRRVNTADSDDSGDPVVEDVAASGLTFTFLESDGTALDFDVPGEEDDEGDIGIVLVSLDIAVNQGTNTQGTQTLTTAIDLRNRL